MKRLMLVLMLIAIAVSGCMEKGPSEKEHNVDNIKTQAVKSSGNLSTYSVASSLNQTLKLNSPQGNVTTISNSINRVASLDLARFRSKANDSYMNAVETSGEATNKSSFNATTYEIGNSTFRKVENDIWVHLKDPRPAEAIWSNGNKNQVQSFSQGINYSQIEIVGSEKIDGEDTYKLKIVPESGDYDNLYNTAIGIAAQLTRYPLLVPSINTTELNNSMHIEKLAWISKGSYLPRKYQGNMSFKMTPLIVGGLDPNTNEMKKFNQSVFLGEVSVNLDTTDIYYDFNKPTEITPPEKALKTVPIIPNHLATSNAEE